MKPILRFDLPLNDVEIELSFDLLVLLCAGASNERPLSEAIGWFWMEPNYLTCGAACWTD